jgi:putative intracellular protease/amidase
MDSVAALLFDGFELLDVFGPLEAFGHLAESGKCRLITVAERAGAIASRQGPERSPITTSRTVRNFRCCWYLEESEPDARLRPYRCLISSAAAAPKRKW